MMIYIPFVLVTLIFIFFLLKIRHSLWLGATFIFWAGTTLVTFILVAEAFNQAVPFMLLAFVIFFIFFGLPLYIISFIWILFQTGFKLLRREGFRLTNLLSLLLGVFILFWFLILPWLPNRFEDPLIRGMISYWSFVSIYALLTLLFFSISLALNLLPVLFKKYHYIIVLGCGLIDNEITPLLASRVDLAIRLYHQNIKKGHPVKIIFSGGVGDGKNRSESAAMGEYALSKGVDEKNILLEEKSKNTHENIKNAKEIIEKHEAISNRNHKGNILIVTSNFHVLRALMVADEQQLKCDGRGSRTKFYFLINALIREYIAVLYQSKKLHILILLLGLILNILQIMINTYYVLPY